MTTKRALLCVSNTRNLFYIGKTLSDLDYQLIGSGDTTNLLRSDGLSVRDVTEITGVPEFLGGRVDSLHPAILSGILARSTCADQTEMEKQNFDYISVVVCNLTAFVNTATQPRVVAGVAYIDIERATLLEAAAKNHLRVTVICDVDDYIKVLEEIEQNGETSLQTRKMLALKAFTHICTYNDAIFDYFCKQYMNPFAQLNLPFGMNRHQTPAQIFTKLRRFPFHVKHGALNFINMCNALLGWQLVDELAGILKHPAAASYKHFSPVGVALSKALSIEQAKLYRVDPLFEALTPVASAYVRARNTDPLSSIGDFIALSDRCDWVTATIIARDTSDGIIAPGYDEEALNILKSKSNFCILKVSSTFDAPTIERRMIFGLTLEQQRNSFAFGGPLFKKFATQNQCLPVTAEYNLVLAAVTLKYTQSISVCYALDAQVIGLGAAQPSHIQCTRLAGNKADNWWLRQHSRVANMRFKNDVNHDEVSYAIDNFVNGTVGKEMPIEKFQAMFEEVPVEFKEQEKKEWLNELNGVALVSDDFFPNRDNVDRARWSGVNYIATPLGSENHDDIVAACDEYNMILSCLDTSIYHH